MLIRLSTAANSVVSLDEVKARLRVDHVDDDDALTNLILSEQFRYEEFTNRIMQPLSYELRLSGFSHSIEINVYPIREITKVSYLDVNHELQDLDALDWYFEANESGCTVYFTEVFVAPVLSSRANPVRVFFDAGLDDMNISGSGDVAELVPDEKDKNNIIMMVQRIYDGDDQMSFDDMRHKMGHRRIFR